MIFKFAAYSENIKPKYDFEQDYNRKKSWNRKYINFWRSKLV